MARRRIVVLAMCAALAALSASAAPAAEKGNEELPILFTADQVSYDREKGIVRATGHVEASHGERVLLADSITFDRKQNLLTASGNLTLLEPSGQVVFADQMELTGDFKNGVIENIRMILADGARFAAVGARRSQGAISEMRKAVYSPCNLCPEHPRRAPLWQIKAVKVLHDQNAKRIEFSDAWLEIAGIPVAYTPFLSIPDPTVKRKSGFLAPSIGNSSDLGFLVSLPFYWAISDDKDATITPIYTSNEGPVLAVEYRQAMRHGRFNMRGSMTEDSSNDFRGNVFSELRYDINETWRMGIDFNRTTDDTYLRRYGFGDQRNLTSRAFVEGFRGRNYLVANGYTFQNLSDTGPQEDQPIVLPLLNYSYVGNADRLGGRVSLDLDLEAVTRDQGADTQRLSARAGWALPLRDSLGSIYSFKLALWMDGYNVSNQVIAGQPGTFSGITGRVFPQASLQWRLPLVRDGETFDQVLQPVAEVVVAPNGANPAEIPNEDSRDIELDETNLFGFRRFPGIDRVQDGSRINYGLQWKVLGPRGGSATTFVGQSYRFGVDDLFPTGSSLGGRFSDIVGGLRISFPPWLSIVYRTSIDSDNFSFRRNELSFSGGVEAIRLSGGYVFFDQVENSELPGREELSLNLSGRLTRYWRARVFGLRDLAEDGGQLVLGAGLTYEDECFLFGATWTRERFDDRDLRPSDTFFFRIALKTLGDVGAGF